MITSPASQPSLQPTDHGTDSAQPDPTAGGAHQASQVKSALDDDHGRLQELTARLGSVQGRDALTEALEDLAHSLRDHFSHEEHATGLYGLLGGRSPAHRAETARLVAEHREILRDLGHLVAQAQERPAPTRALEREAADLAARLHDHEKREMKLVEALA